MSRLVTVTVISIGSIIGVYGLMKAITPKPEELVKQLPEHNPQHMRSSQRQASALREALQKAADDPNPIYRK